MSSTIKTILIIVVISAALIAAYVLFVQPNISDQNDSSTLESTTQENGESSETAQAGSSSAGELDLVSILTSLRELELNDSILFNSAFGRLQDISMPLQDSGRPGRSNPFAPIGEDLSYQPVNSENVNSNTSDGPGSSIDQCSSLTCFENNFASCKATSFVQETASAQDIFSGGGEEAADMPAAEYRILEPRQGNKCAVRITATTTVNESSTTLSMTCPFDRDSTFTEQFLNTSDQALQSREDNCTGGLVEHWYVNGNAPMLQ